MLRLIILAVATGSGGLAAYLTLIDKPAAVPAGVIAAPAPATSLEEVLVASADLSPGRTVQAESFRWQPWPKEAVAAGFISRSARPDAMTQLVGSLVRSQFRSGEPMREDKLAPPGSGFMAAMLPSGQRAVAVRISAESTAGGFVLPNDRVDVVHTVSRPGGELQPAEIVSRTILRNIRVLAVGQTQNPDPESEQMVAVGETATLELSLPEVETITAAEASGTLSLALRPAADNDEAPETAEGRSATVRVHREGRIEAVKVSPSR